MGSTVGFPTARPLTLLPPFLSTTLEQRLFSMKWKALNSWVLFRMGIGGHLRNRRFRGKVHEDKRPDWDAYSAAVYSSGYTLGLDMNNLRVRSTSGTYAVNLSGGNTLTRVSLTNSNLDKDVFVDSSSFTQTNNLIQVSFGSTRWLGWLQQSAAKSYLRDYSRRHAAPTGRLSPSALPRDSS